MLQKRVPNGHPLMLERWVCAQGDMRVPKGECLRWALSADAEALAWLPALDTGFVVSTEDGTVAAFDARSGSGCPALSLPAPSCRCQLPLQLPIACLGISALQPCRSDSELAESVCWQDVTA